MDLQIEMLGVLLRMLEVGSYVVIALSLWKLAHKKGK